MKFEKKYISARVTVIVVVAVLFVVAIIARAVVTATVENERWKKLGAVSVGDTVPLPAARGNILSADGQLMASSLPDYKVYIDFLSGVERYDSLDARGNKLRVYDAEQMAKKDTMWLESMAASAAASSSVPRYSQAKRPALTRAGEADAS